jgi:hypothetical protein
LGLSFKLRKGKKVLKELFKDVLPDEIINRDKLALKSEEVRSKSVRDNTLENIKIFNKEFK